MTTAADIRALMPVPVPTTDDLVAEVVEACKLVAKQGGAKIRMTAALASADRFNMIHEYVYERVKECPIASVCQALEQLGFETKILYEERQFVDLDVIVSWAE